MQYFRIPLLSILLISLVCTFNSCIIIDPGQGGGGENTYCFWLAASKDAHVTSYYPDFNNDGAFSLVCSHGEPNKENRSYIEFFMPQLPDDTEVLEAYINVYEDSRQQPGSGQISVGIAVAEWDPYTITWNNQPNPLGPLGPTHIGTFIDVNMWRKTEDIKDLVQNHLDNPDDNYGWIFNNSSTYNFTRSFSSMNALSARTRTELQNGPRLLMKVKSTVPITTANIGTTLTGSTELGNMYGFGTEFLIYRISSGAEWPEDWEVATQ